MVLIHISHWNWKFNRLRSVENRTLNSSTSRHLYQKIGFQQEYICLCVYIYIWFAVEKMYNQHYIPDIVASSHLFSILDNPEIHHKTNVGMVRYCDSNLVYFNLEKSWRRVKNQKLPQPPHLGWRAAKWYKPNTKKDKHCMCRFYKVHIYIYYNYMHYIVTACHHSMIFSITIWTNYKNPSLQLLKSVGDWQEQHNAQLLEVPPKMGNPPAICVTPNYSFWNPQTSPNQADLDLFPLQTYGDSPKFLQAFWQILCGLVCRSQAAHSLLGRHLFVPICSGTGSQAIQGHSNLKMCVKGGVVGDKKIHQNPSKSIKIHQNPSKSIKIHQNPSKSIKIHQNPSKSQFFHLFTRKNHRVSSSKVSFATRARVTSSSEWPTATWGHGAMVNHGLLGEIYRKPMGFLMFFGPKYREILQIFTRILG